MGTETNEPVVQQTEEKEKEKFYFYSLSAGLRIGNFGGTPEMPTKERYMQDGRIHKPDESIKFVNHMYMTDSQKEAKFIREFMKKHPGVVFEKDKSEYERLYRKYAEGLTAKMSAPPIVSNTAELIWG